MTDTALIETKLADITKYLDKLEKFAALSEHEFVSSDVHYQAERFVEIIVGDALDINFHLIKTHRLDAPIKYKDSFRIVGQAKLIGSELAERIADSAGLRNILVHHYDELDLSRFYQGLAGGIADYRQYVSAIFRAVNK